MLNTPDMQWTAHADWIDAEDETIVAIRPGYVVGVAVPDSSAAWPSRRNLIAAAPDMLAALRMFRDFANSGAAFNYPPGSLQALDAAIAKATTP